MFIHIIINYIITRLRVLLYMEKLSKHLMKQTMENDNRLYRCSLRIHQKITKVEHVKAVLWIVLKAVDGKWCVISTLPQNVHDTLLKVVLS